eukprot:5018972-Pleurochrysis_carterae.AAC.2
MSSMIMWLQSKRSSADRCREGSAFCFFTPISAFCFDAFTAEWTEHNGQANQCIPGRIQQEATCECAHAVPARRCSREHLTRRNSLKNRGCRHARAL